MVLLGALEHFHNNALVFKRFLTKNLRFLIQNLFLLSTVGFISKLACHKDLVQLYRLINGPQWFFSVRSFLKTSLIFKFSQPLLMAFNDVKLTRTIMVSDVQNGRSLPALQTLTFIDL